MSFRIERFLIDLLTKEFSYKFTKNKEQTKTKKGTNRQQ